MGALYLAFVPLTIFARRVIPCSFNDLGKVCWETDSDGVTTPQCMVYSYDRQHSQQ